MNHKNIQIPHWKISFTGLERAGLAGSLALAYHTKMYSKQFNVLSYGHKAYFQTMFTEKAQNQNAHLEPVENLLEEGDHPVPSPPPRLLVEERVSSLSINLF